MASRRVGELLPLLGKRPVRRLSGTWRSNYFSCVCVRKLFPLLLLQANIQKGMLQHAPRTGSLRKALPLEAKFTHAHECQPISDKRLASFKNSLASSWLFERKHFSTHSALLRNANDWAQNATEDENTLQLEGNHA